MASLYERAKSPFIWIKFRDPVSGKIKQESTGFRRGIGPQERQAKVLAAEKSLAELKASPAKVEERWANWVGDFLKVKYASSAKTLQRYNTAWANLRMFFESVDVLCPRHLTRDHCMKFMTWRQVPDKKKGKYKACHNTALLELKILSLIMAEALERAYCPFNPCRDLKIGKMDVKEKPEYTDDDITFIRDKIAIEDEPQRTFLNNSFEIARYHGCRLSETHLNPMTAVTFTRDHSGKVIKGKINFKTKGRRTHTPPLHSALWPLFERLQAEGKTETYERPPNPSRTWWNFLNRIGVKKKNPNACFHSLRVTAATRLARSNEVKESSAMKYLGHASVTIHRAYQRLRSDDLDDCLDALD